MPPKQKPKQASKQSKSCSNDGETAHTTKRTGGASKGNPDVTPMSSEQGGTKTSSASDPDETMAEPSNEGDANANKGEENKQTNMRGGGSSGEEKTSNTRGGETNGEEKTTAHDTQTQSEQVGTNTASATNQVMGGESEVMSGVTQTLSQHVGTKTACATAHNKTKANNVGGATSHAAGVAQETVASENDKDDMGE